MNIDLPEPECIECGAKNSETFRQGNATKGSEGRRCLQCGHENSNSWGPLGERSGQTYTANHTRPSF